jgi:hypothetical protein
MMKFASSMLKNSITILDYLVSYIAQEIDNNSQVIREICIFGNLSDTKIKNSMVWVRERTVPTEWYNKI